MLPTYHFDVDELTRRVLELIPSNPKILTMLSPFEMLEIAEFEYKDLEPSTIQLSHAIGKAISIYNDNQKYNRDPERITEAMKNTEKFRLQMQETAKEAEKLRHK
jgi:hypothetical protein